MIVGNGIGLSVPVESAPQAPTFAARPPHDQRRADQAGRRARAFGGLMRRPATCPGPR